MGRSKLTAERGHCSELFDCGFSYLLFSRLYLFRRKILKQEKKRFYVIAVSFHYTHPIFSCGLSSEKICIESQVTNLDIDQSGILHCSVLRAQACFT